MTTIAQQPTSVSHRGDTIVFATIIDAVTGAGSLHYNVLRPRADVEDDDEARSGYLPLEFPGQVAPAGMSLVRVDREVPPRGWVQAVSDQQCVFLFWASGGAIYACRYRLVDVPDASVRGATRPELQPAWEVRYQVSGSPDLPASDKDTLGPRSPDGVPFVEPIFELPISLDGIDLERASFAMLLEPTAEESTLRWQLFVPRLSTGTLQCYSFARDADGWFAIDPQQIDAASGTLRPDAQVTLLADGAPLPVAGSVTAVNYLKQEAVATSSGDTVKTRRNHRVMLTVPVTDLEASRIATLDFAVATDGRLSGLAPAAGNGTTELTYEAGRVSPAASVLAFDGAATVAIPTDAPSGPLVLPGAFTMEAWIWPEATSLDAQVIVGGSLPLGDASHAPTLWVRDQLRIGASFGDGTNVVAVVSRDNVLTLGAWVHVAAVNGPRGLLLYVNGTPVPLAAPGAPAAPASQPLTTMGATGRPRTLQVRGEAVVDVEALATPFVGMLDEMRVWTSALDEARLRQWLYKEIPEEEARQMPDLAGYWRMDNGSGTVVTDFSASARDGVLAGAAWVATSAPMVSDADGTLYLDPFGLSTFVGLLAPSDDHPLFGELAAGTRPALLFSADGLVRLYYEAGGGGTFCVAHYDATIDRAVHALPWVAGAIDPPSIQRGTLQLLARQSGSAPNHGSATATRQHDGQLVTLELADGLGAVETWTALPTSADRLCDIVDGRATADPVLAAASGRAFYDYAGRRLLARLSGSKVPGADPQSQLWFASSRFDAFALRRVALAATSDELGDFTVEIASDDAPGHEDERLRRTIRDVPRELGTFLRTLGGGNGHFAATQPAGPDDTVVHPIAANPVAVAALVPPSSKVRDARFETTPGATSLRCSLLARLTLADDSVIEAAWADLPRATDDFLAALAASTEPSQRDVLSRLRLMAPGTPGQVLDAVSDAPAGVGAFLALVLPVNEGVTGLLPDFALATDVAHGATPARAGDDLSTGSRLYVAAMQGEPTNGYPAELDLGESGQATASMVTPGRDGGWISESPQYAVRIHEGGAMAADVERAGVQALALRDDVTVEAWAQLQESPSSAAGRFYPRIVHADLASPAGDSRYFLGLVGSEAVQLLSGSRIRTNDASLADTQANLRIFPDPSNFSLQVYVNPDLSTAQADNVLFQVIGLGTGQADPPSLTLLLGAGGAMKLRLVPYQAPPVEIAAGTLAGGTWQMVTLTRSPRALTVLVDATVANIVNDPPPIVLKSGEVLVAGNQPTSALQVQMTAFSVWRRALAVDEVAASRFRPIDTADHDLQLFWGLDGGDTSMAVSNSALVTQGHYDTVVEGDSPRAYWTYPGLFYRAVFASHDLAACTRHAVAGLGEWHHYAGIYRPRPGVRLDGRQFADCGADASLDARAALSLEAWLWPAAASGVRQAVVSKYGDAADARSYELALDAAGRPSLSLRVLGQTTNGGGAVAERLRLKTYTAPQALAPDVPAYVVATAAIVSVTDDETQRMTYSVSGQVYVNGQPTLAGPAQARPWPDDKAPTFLLQVVGGSGSGRYPAGTAVPIAAADPGAFQRWRGTTTGVAQPGAAVASITMPAKDVVITATGVFESLELAASATPLSLGRASTTDGEGSAFYRGGMADVRLWRAELTAAGIARAYATRTDPGASDNLVSAWMFTEGEGKVAHDSHSTNDARLSDSRVWTHFEQGARLELMVDGLSVAVDTMPAGSFGDYGPKQFRMGADRDEDGVLRNPLLGSIDEVRVWSGARTPRQVRENMNRYLVGDEAGLAGYWSFNNGAGSTIVDGTGNGNDLRFEYENPDARPQWETSTAPISDEAPPVRNALGGRDTPYVRSIVEGPAVFEYGAVERDAQGKLLSVVRRAYCYRTALESHLETGYKVGDLVLVYIGQVQTRPTLIGYVEGAPPLPSENLTRPFYLDPIASYFNYDDIGSVTLTETAGTSVTVTASREDTRAVDSSFAFGVSADNKVYGGVDIGAIVIMYQEVKAQGRGGLKTDIGWSDSSSQGAALSAETNRSRSLHVSSGGDWESPADVFLDSGERRYVPANDGCALVKSATADLYGQVLQSTGALYGLTVIPNPDIPEDVNLIYFPIDTHYVRNGSLDGRVGLKSDPDCGGQPSYYRPREAYDLQRRIEHQTAQVEAWYAQVDAAARGRSQNADIADLAASDPLRDWANGTPRKDMMNKYVWSASGGLYAEQEDYTSERQESFGGGFDFSWRLGGNGSLEFDVGPVGLYFELEVMGGQGWTVTVEKEKSERSAVGLEIEVAPDNCLSRFLGRDQEPPYTRLPVPGKVDGYRFASYYLAPTKGNTATFFDQVVDPVWFASSNDPGAVALREAQASGVGKSSWRVLHRVTYVSRVPPPFQAVPVVGDVHPIPFPPHLDANALVLGLVHAHLGEDGDPTPVDLAKAIDQVLDTDLAAMLPWWRAFHDAARVPNSPQARALTALREGMTRYVRQYYAAQR